MNDRRRPLGGVEKDTFVHSAEDPQKNAELTYDLLFGMKSEICFALDEIKQQCTCRADQCGKRFEKLENRKKWDFSVSAIMGLVGGAAAMIGKIAFWK